MKISDDCKKLQAAVKRFSYKPGTKIQIRNTLVGFTLTTNIPTTHDSTTRRKERNFLSASVSIPRNALFHKNGRVKVGELKGSILRQVRELELHEMEEWLRHDGRTLHAAHF